MSDDQNEDNLNVSIPQIPPPAPNLGLGKLRRFVEHDPLKLEKMRNELYFLDTDAEAINSGKRFYDLLYFQPSLFVSCGAWDHSSGDSNIYCFEKQADKVKKVMIGTKGDCYSSLVKIDENHFLSVHSFNRRFRLFQRFMTPNYNLGPSLHTHDREESSVTCFSSKTFEKEKEICSEKFRPGIKSMMKVKRDLVAVFVPRYRYKDFKIDPRIYILSISQTRILKEVVYRKEETPDPYLLYTNLDSDVCIRNSKIYRDCLYVSRFHSKDDYQINLIDYQNDELKRKYMMSESIGTMIVYIDHNGDECFVGSNYNWLYFYRSQSSSWVKRISLTDNHLLNEIVLDGHYLLSSRINAGNKVQEMIIWDIGNDSFYNMPRKIKPIFEEEVCEVKMGVAVRNLVVIEKNASKQEVVFAYTLGNWKIGLFKVSGFKNLSTSIDEIQKRDLVERISFLCTDLNRVFINERFTVNFKGGNFVISKFFFSL